MHHIEDLGTPLAADLPYLPDLLRAHGYHTAAFVGAEILSADTLAAGFDRGFDLYDGHFHQQAAGEDRYKSVERRAEDVANRAMGWLSQNQQGPFFIWMHFYDPHDPYDPPEPFKSHSQTRRMTARLPMLTPWWAAFLRCWFVTDSLKNCAIAIAADHGEAFGEHGEEHHGIFLYDETIHVPFLLKLPRERLAGTRVDEKVPLARLLRPCFKRLALLYPQACKPARCSCWQSHLKTRRAARGSELAEQPVYSETNYNRRTFGWAMLRSWRTGNYLYVQAPKRELYDQATDPGANHNIAGASPAIAGALQAQLQEFWDKTSGGEAASPKLDPSQEEKLHALGYLPASDSSTAHDSAEVDPKDKTEVLNRFHRALTSKDEDRYDDAIAGFQDVIRMEPNLGGAYLELGGVFAIRNRYDEAIPILRKAVEKMPDSGSAHFQLGLALVRMKQWDAALPEMQAAVACTPGAFLFHLDLASVLVQQRRIPEAKVEYEKALDIKPNNFEVNFFYGRLLLQQGRANMALPRLTRAVRSNPDSADAHVFLAEAYEKLGRLKEANQERAKAAQLKSQPPG